jgi:putative chitinase
MNDLLTLLEPNGAPLIPAMQRFGIGSPLEQAHFLAQVAHESAGFEILTENLNYGSVGLQRTWPHRFTLSQALDYAHHPQRIANRVYANRLGNGDELSGDGWNYRGAGFIQITGKRNYADVSQALFDDDRLVAQPDRMALPENAALSAGYFWIENNIGLHAMHDSLEEVTRAVNGGLNGLEDRRAWLLKFKSALGVPT